MTSQAPQQVNLKVKKLDPRAILPTRGSERSSGLDLYALEGVSIPPGETKLVRTGIAFGIPEGYEIQVRPRSGLSLSTGLTVKNSPGTVDQDYTGECAVIMCNVGKTPHGVSKGSRIAQAVLCPVIIPTVQVVDELQDSARGTNGFGSTGK